MGRGGTSAAGGRLALAWIAGGFCGPSPCPLPAGEVERTCSPKSMGCCGRACAPSSRRVAPHTDEWRRRGRFRDVLAAAGRNWGFSGWSFRWSMAGRAAISSRAWCWARRWRAGRSGGVAFSVLVAHGHVLTLAHAVWDGGAEEKVPAPHRERRRPSARSESQSRGRAPIWRISRPAPWQRRHTCSRQQDLHHQRVYGDLTSSRRERRPARLNAASDGISCSSSSAGCRFHGEPELDKMACAPRTPRSWPFTMPCPLKNWLGVEGRGFQQLAAGLQRERIMAAVLALSGRGRRWGHGRLIRERQAFGEPLSKKQALRHKIAERRQKSRRRAIWSITRGVLQRWRGLHHRGLHGQALRDEVANRVAYQAVQMHGATATCGSSRSSAFSATFDFGLSVGRRRS